jgi:hypothetical protein
MEPKYTAQQIEGTDNGWMLIENETDKKYIVFCNANANTAEDAVALIENKSEGLPE